MQIIAPCLFSWRFIYIHKGLMVCFNTDFFFPFGGERRSCFKQDLSSLPLWNHLLLNLELNTQGHKGKKIKNKGGNDWAVSFPFNYNQNMKSGICIVTSNVFIYILSIFSLYKMLYTITIVTYSYFITQAVVKICSVNARCFISYQNYLSFTCSGNNNDFC